MNIYTLFIQILRMGATASIVIVTVFVVRALMHRFPKKYAYLLWVIVGIRLICPFAFSSSISLFNLKPLMDSRNAVSPYALTQQQTKQADSTNNSMTAKMGRQTANHTENNTVVSQPDKNHKSSTVQSSSDSERTQNHSSLTEAAAGHREAESHPVLQTLSLLWLAGIIVLLLWNVYLTIRMKQRLNRAVMYRDHIYECDSIPSPFVMGLLRPRIYIPFRLNDTERNYILAHEQHHIRRKDYVIKAAAFLLVILYWFHPLVWISYFCMVRDMEMSCDEYVLAASDAQMRRNYSQSLLAFATNQRHFSMGLLSFGETDTRRRVKHVLKFRNGGKWMGIIAVLLVAGVAFVCLTNGKSSTKTTTDHDTRKIIGTCTIHNYETKLLMNKGRQIKDNTSSFDKLYEGNFVLATYRDGKKVDELEIKAKNNDPVMHFPTTISLHVWDYDGDHAADDFAIGQPLGSSAMTYQFFTVEENGSILPFTVSEEPMDYIIAAKDEYSPEFLIAEELISYTKYEPKTGKTEKGDFNLSKKIDLKKSPDTETALVKKMKAAVTTVMPEKVVNEIKNKQWEKTWTDTYSVANTEDFDTTTLRLDFTFKQNTLTDYVSNEYGFVDDMPEERITKREGIALVQKFAENFLDRNLEKSELHVAEFIPPRYDNKDYLVVRDTQDGLYVVQLSRNMVVMFTQTKMVYLEEDEPTTPSEIKQILSAKVTYRGKTDNDSVTQTITDQGTLDILAQILSTATPVRGGITCPFGDAVLTLYLNGGEEMNLTWACDSCRIFRINGVYYEYIDAFLSTSPDGIRGYFDKIPWN